MAASTRRHRVARFASDNDLVEYNMLIWTFRNNVVVLNYVLFWSVVLTFVFTKIILYEQA